MERCWKASFRSLTVLLLLLLTFAACGKAGGPPEDVIERASAAAGDVTSFHFSMSVTLSVEEAGEIDVAEGVGDYLAPDRVWVRGMPGEEQIFIGRNLYRRGSESSEWSVGEISEAALGYANMMDPQSNLGYLEWPGEGLVWLEDEIIDGVDTWHYRKRLDPLASMIEGWTEVIEAERVKLWGMADSLRGAETTLEMEWWIGKEDYLVRQVRSVQSMKALRSDEVFDIAIPEGARYTITTTMRTSGFSEPVAIEAPF